MKRVVVLLGVFLFFSILNDGFASGKQEKRAEAGAKLEFWDMVWGPAETYNPTVQRMVDAFSKESGIPTKVQFIGWDTWYQTFFTAVTSNSAPDVATTAFPLPIQFAGMGEALVLDSIVEEWEKEKHPILQDLSQEMFDIYKWQGHQVAFPWDIQPSSIMYRKDVFSELGLAAPTTWDEFLTSCRTIKAKKPGMIPFSMAVGDHISYHVMMAFLFQNGVGFLTPDLKPNMNDPRVIRTMQFFTTLMNEGLVPPGTNSYRQPDAEKIYLSGNAAIFYGYGLPTTAEKDYPQIYRNTATMPILKGPDASSPKMMGWYNPIMAFKQTKYPEAAKRFIKWYMDHYMVIYTEGMRSSFPTRESYRKDPFFTKFPLLDEQNRLLVKNVVTPPWPAPSLYLAYTRIEGEIYPGVALQKVFTGRTDYKAIAEETNEKIQQALTELK